MFPTSPESRLGCGRIDPAAPNSEPASRAVDSELRRRKRFLDFDTDDVARLVGIRELSEEYAESVIEEFYAHLLAFEAAAVFFANPDVLAHVKGEQKKYFLRLTEGGYDAAYADNRLEVGAAHERIGLPVDLYLGMYSFYLRAVAARLSEAFADEPGRASATFESLLKLVFLDIGLALDTYISEREATINRQQESLSRFATIVEASDDAIISTTPEGLVATWNSGAERLYGYTAAEMVGQPLSLLVPEGREAVFQSIRDGKVVHPFEGTRVRKDGSLVVVSKSTAPIRGSDGAVTGVAMVDRDISELKEAEATRAALESQLQQSQKMESIGRLTGGIAHDFNNLLVVIRGYGAALLERPGTEADHDDLRKIDAAAERATLLTRQLLAFSRQQVLHRELTDVNKVVEDTLKLLERVIGSDIELVRDFEPQLRPTVLDRAQLGQVLLNLFVNAREAMPGGGTLTVRTANADIDESYAQTHLDAVPGPHVLLQITDSGIGMDKQTVANVFEPFFTTKDGGTGLGLATVFGIVKQSGGHIWIYSEPGLGTTFKIYFPHETIADAPAPERKPSTLHGDETILLVEDNEAVRALVEGILEYNGYTVISSSDGAEAIDAAANHDGAIDLLLTDIVMPGLNGREVAETLVGTRPELKVLFTSGYPADATVRNGIADKGVPFIEKPYLPNDLARAIRTVLDQPPG